MLRTAASFFPNRLWTLGLRAKLTRSCSTASVHTCCGYRPASPPSPAGPDCPCSTTASARFLCLWTPPMRAERNYAPGTPPLAPSSKTYNLKCEQLRFTEASCGRGLHSYLLLYATTFHRKRGHDRDHSCSSATQATKSCNFPFPFLRCMRLLSL